MARENALPGEIAALSFEDALKELETIVQQLERGQVKLDDAISAYERGTLLKRHCENKLQEAKMKVEKIVLAPNGAVGSEPASIDRGEEHRAEHEPDDEVQRASIRLCVGPRIAARRRGSGGGAGPL